MTGFSGHDNSGSRPVAESLPNEVKENIKKVEGVSDVNLNLVWEPPWDKDKMSEAAKLELNL